ncbi:chromatin segregase YTA7 KNAG_0K00280 [Huiozyma naganishii CBS 8797]|uniref:Bromo domain-containing protein n=1 Tax=Huiozyma naganishii (strain ATCC MYA-139 / BCRC 22969 / CBS 8797 / KCTC 17520 / NBRC 10181 / NCYC 3082 / Yp74L-3) TaxID=1071383 RepID=J7SAR0_HUIN7|nr:hypothetical protein KNAG_0K00280 [Kazachstania naganishii CBS 8797]CCK72396.1 hypothetical protein KNAG_0K00280 [Kazachstania naganishii CBS 8797]
MPRHLRNRDAEGVPDGDGIKDENGVVHTSTRSLRKINYAEIESGLDYLEDEEGAEQGGNGGTNTEPHNGYTGDPLANGPSDELDLHESAPVAGGRGRGRKRKKNSRYDAFGDDEDDESFHEEDVADEAEDGEDDDDDDDPDAFDEYRESQRVKRQARTRQDNNFIVPDPESDQFDDDDDDDDENAIYYSNRRNKRGKRAAATAAAAAHNQYPTRRSTRTRNADRGPVETTPPPSSSARRHLRPRGRTSSHLDGYNLDPEAPNGTVAAGDGERDHLTLADEIRELQEDSPIRELRPRRNIHEASPPTEKRSLRERTKPVNYAIPPPLTALTADAFPKGYQAASPSRRGKQNMGPPRRLFPTGGPFGGNDVMTIFGQNTNFYGLSTGLGNRLPGNGPANKLLLDSNSSEDEILALGAKSKKNDDPLKKKKKKKPEIADLDPLGVDMNINFNDVGGLDSYIDQLKEMVALPLLYPELYQNFDITPPRGVLFHGPPGTGKTLMARALAASCSTENRKITFFMRKGADILSKWVGEAERQLRLLFEEAKKQQPSIIFFDEIDGLAPVRSSKQEQIHASIVSTLLALMDGMDNRGQVIVIGATNRPDAVDPALRRPGRFDREFYFPLPDEKARARILTIHTKKWDPPLTEEFLQNLARLTKGYGGADLRSLCTEAALLCIQRNFPQIYRSDEKLVVDKSKLKVNTKDFILALQKIVPSSARSVGSGTESLPEIVKPLLHDQFDQVKNIIERLLPIQPNKMQDKSSIIQHYIDYEDLNEGEEDSISLGFGKQELLGRIAESRIFKPKLLITGPIGNGQQYIGSAILYSLEHFNVQKIDVASLVSESSRSIEAAIVQAFAEAQKRQPALLYIPNLDIWQRTVPETAILTLASLIRSLQSNERILLLAISEALEASDLQQEPLSHLFSKNNIFTVQKPSLEQRQAFFQKIVDVLRIKPLSFETERKRTKPLPELPRAGREANQDNLDEDGQLLSPEDVVRKKLKTLQYQDMKMKNVLKIKLSGLMDLFKTRYKRFRKPPIDDALLVHLFEEPPADPTWQPTYVKDGDMILEVLTGRRFYNMDLDIVEERLWNGYYSEPKQFLKDIELIYIDSNTLGDRDRIIKASEMFANAQIGIEDISTPDFIQGCKALRRRDFERQQLALEDAEKQVEVAKQMATEETALINGRSAMGPVSEVAIGEGQQMQAQLQVVPPSQLPESTENGATLDLTGEEPQDLGRVTAPEYSTSGTENVTATVSGSIEKSSPLEKETPLEENSRHQVPVDTEEPVPAESVKETANGSSNVPAEVVAQSANDLNVVTCPTESPSHEMRKEEHQLDYTSEKEGGKEEVAKIELDDRDVIMDADSLRQLNLTLEKLTDGATVSTLEEMYAGIMEIIWDDRFKWDKTETIEKIERSLAQ